MQDVAYVGLTVAFFIVVALIGAGADRLGRRDGTGAATDEAAADALARPEARP